MDWGMRGWFSAPSIPLFFSIWKKVFCAMVSSKLAFTSVYRQQKLSMHHYGQYTHNGSSNIPLLYHPKTVPQTSFLRITELTLIGGDKE